MLPWHIFICLTFSKTKYFVPAVRIRLDILRSKIWFPFYLTASALTSEALFLPLSCCSPSCGMSNLPPVIPQSLFSPTCFSYASQYISRYESQGQGSLLMPTHGRDLLKFAICHWRPNVSNCLNSWFLQAFIGTTPTLHPSVVTQRPLVGCAGWWWSTPSSTSSSALTFAWSSLVIYMFI